LFKFKKGENFNHRNTLSISRIKLKLHFVHNVETDEEIGQKGAFCKGLKVGVHGFKGSQVQGFRGLKVQRLSNPKR